MGNGALTVVHQNRFQPIVFHGQALSPPTYLSLFFFNTCQLLFIFFAWLFLMAKVVNLMVILSIFLICSKLQHTYLLQILCQNSFYAVYWKISSNFDQNLLAKSMEKKLEMKKKPIFLESEPKKYHEKVYGTKSIFNQSCTHLVTTWLIAFYVW